MELIAVCSALKELASDKRSVGIYTDSSYVIRGITEWIWGWRKRGWTTSTGDDVSNRDLWEWLSELVAARSSKVSWHYVRGHAGIPGNERVDEIAVAFTKNQHVDLYEGPLIRYQVAIFDIPDDTSLPEMKERKVKVAAYSYLSLVDGRLRRHSTWADCERLVKGRSGAKFKKAASEKEEVEILAAWGYAQKDLDH
jgi:ribonuclease HI